MKRLIALLCALLLLTAALSGCRRKGPEAPGDTDDTAPAAQKAIALPYNAEDSLNPFAAEDRRNLELWSLLFEPLFRLSAGSEAEPVLAADLKMDGVRVAVSVRTDVLFSNGDALTARDVAYSFSCAKESPTFSARLSNFFSCTVEDDAAVFTLFSPNVDCANCLNFPIVKFGTAASDIPVGSGRYRLSLRGSAPTLNPRDPENTALPPLKLVDVSLSENVPYLLQIGDLSFLTCDPELEPGEKISATDVHLPMNNLVFLGFNASDDLLADAALRGALCAALDRTALTDNAYGPDATATSVPFNPAWYKLPPQETPQTTASERLDAAGYLLASPGDEVRVKDGTPLELTLIVNGENATRAVLAEGIQTALQALGVRVKLEKLSYESYRERLEQGDFMMYLGEVKLPGDFDLSVFFADGADARFGLTTLSTVKGAYTDYRSGAIDLSTFLKVFDEEAPFAPLCCRNLTFYYTRALETDGSANVNDPFCAIESWRLN